MVFDNLHSPPPPQKCKYCVEVLLGPKYLNKKPQTKTDNQPQMILVQRIPGSYFDI